MLLYVKGVFGMTPPETAFKLPQSLAPSCSAQEAGWLSSFRAWPAVRQPQMDGQLAANLLLELAELLLLLLLLCFFCCSSSWQDMTHSSFMDVCLLPCIAEMSLLSSDRVCTSRAYSFWISQQELLTEQC